MSILSPNLSIMLRAAEKAAKSLIRDYGEVENLQVSRKGLPILFLQLISDPKRLFLVN